MPIEPTPAYQLDNESFGRCLRDIRQRHLVKQVSLSNALGCTDAAISLWENDRRLPSRSTLARLALALANCGVSDDEVASLRACWRKTWMGRKSNGGGNSQSGVYAVADRYADEPAPASQA